MILMLFMCSFQNGLLVLQNVTAPCCGYALGTLFQMLPHSVLFVLFRGVVVVKLCFLLCGTRMTLTDYGLSCEGFRDSSSGTDRDAQGREEH